MEPSPDVFSSKPTYWLTRFMILRLLGFVYFFAYLSLAQQVKPLIGEKGLTPAWLFLARVESGTGSFSRAFFTLPSLFWFGHSDAFMSALAWVGVGLSLAVLGGFANGLILTILWFLYLSFVPVGQDWYGYGWEIQLLETGFLSIFLVPFLDGRPFPKSPPPLQVIWLFRWLIFRIMLGSGLIKWRGDPCWRDLTCLRYHYETQPLPNSFSPYFHFMPLWFHKAGALYNFLVELVCPWFMVLGRRFCVPAGCLMAAFQGILILSGNLSFLNWLTLVPILSCFDDRFWLRFLPRLLAEKAGIAAYRAQSSPRYPKSAWALVAMVAFLSVNPVLNMVSPSQMMNTSFDPLHLVNTYGAFGSVGKERLQLVLEGTSDQVLTKETVWKAYDFKCQPGNLYRRPCFCAPYQYRLDWQVWFAAMSGPSQYPWVFNMIWKLLHNDPGTLSLFAGNPFPDEAPSYIRIRLFRYQFAPLSHPNGQWWERTELGTWLPPLSTGDPRFQRIMMDEGWL